MADTTRLLASYNGMYKNNILYTFASPNDKLLASGYDNIGGSYATYKSVIGFAKSELNAIVGVGIPTGLTLSLYRKAGIGYAGALYLRVGISKGNAYNAEILAYTGDIMASAVASDAFRTLTVSDLVPKLRELLEDATVTTIYFHVEFHDTEDPYNSIVYQGIDSAISTTYHPAANLTTIQGTVFVMESESFAEKRVFVYEGGEFVRKIPYRYVSGEFVTNE